jgi:hypothetical protein
LHGELRPRRDRADERELLVFPLPDVAEAAHRLCGLFEDVVAIKYLHGGVVALGSDLGRWVQDIVVVVFFFGLRGPDLELVVDVRREIVHAPAEFEFGKRESLRIEVVTLLHKRGAALWAVEVYLAYDRFLPRRGGEVALGASGGIELEE